MPLDTYFKQEGNWRHMTKVELGQIYYLLKEVKMWEKELDRLQCQSLVKGQTLTGMPHSPGLSDKVADAAVRKTDIELIISGKLTEIQLQRDKIINYINGIEDSIIRQIVFYRHVSCMTWKQVAEEIGGRNSAESIRQQYKRFMNTEEKKK